MKDRSKGWWIRTGIVTVVCAYILLNIIWLFVVSPLQGHFARQKLFQADHVAVLAACRELISNRQSFPTCTDPSSWQDPDKRVLVVGGSTIDDSVPRVVRELDPIYIRIGTNSVLIRLNARGSREYFLAFADGAEEYGTRELCPGLWYWNGNDNSEKANKPHERTSQ